MNKKTIIILLLALVALVGQAQVKCHIKGELRDTTKGNTVLICPAEVDIRVSDNYTTTKADAQGRFSFDVATDKIGLYRVFLHEQYKNGSWSYKKFIVENNATVSLLFDDDKWTVNSDGYEQMKKTKMDAEAERLYISKMDSLMTDVMNELQPRIEELQRQGKDPREDSLSIKRYQKFLVENHKLYAQYQAWEYEYYKTHPMLFALYDIANQMQSKDEKYNEKATALMNLYHSTYENYHPDNPIHNTIHALETGWKQTPGNPYIDFEVLTAEGERVNVASLYRGKVAVIDLWASWCGPCRKHSKGLIPLYEKYKKLGFVVIGIAREEEVSRMTQAAEKDGYPWQNYIDLKDELKVWQKNGLAFSGGGMFLIDSNGTILSTSTDADELEPLIRKALGLSDEAQEK